MPSKITDLTELAATPDDADLLEIVDDVAGTPKSKKITIANIKAAIPITKIGEATVGAPAATLDLEFTLDASVKILLVFLDLIEISAIDQLNLQIKQGGAWLVTGYASYETSRSTSGSASADYSNSNDAWKLTNDGGTWGFPAGVKLNGHLKILGDVSDIGHKTLFGETWHDAASANHVLCRVSGDAGTSTGAIEGIRIGPEAGNIVAGTIRVYGLS